jgi:mannose-6-phosphate isomerase-like protein (cupin superfamily)
MQNGPSCEVFEYPHHDPEIDGALIRIHGLYPEDGWARNTRSKELAYILEGSGKVRFESEERELKKGDMIIIPQNEWFAWEGNFEMLVVCAPAFRPEQYELKG